MSEETARRTPRKARERSGADALKSVALFLAPFAAAALFFEYTIHRQKPKTTTVKRSQGGKERVTFADVAGNAAAKVELAEIVDVLKNPKPYTDLGARCPRGILLVGPPGTGKTLLARAAAGEASVPFFSLSASSLVEMYAGLGAARVREAFAACRATGGPSLLLIDEIDAMGGARGRAGSISEHDQTLNELLVQMDGFERKAPVIVIGATNRPDMLDPALRRAGRFDRIALVDLPRTPADRLAILKVYTRKVKLAPGVDLAAIAAETDGLAGATLATLINEAALLAARRRAPAIAQEDLVLAAKRALATVPKSKEELDQEEANAAARRWAQAERTAKEPPK